MPANAGPEKGGQHVLQAALSMGLSATEGFHAKDIKHVDPSFDGMAIVIPQDIVPNPKSRVTFKGKHDDVEFPYLSWGAWPWGDEATWHWSADEMGNLKEAWKQAVEAGATWIDTAQAYGGGESERICGDLVKDLPRDSYQIQTKWYVVPDSTTTNLLHPVQAPADILRGTLKRMGPSYIDCYLVHGHIHVSSIKRVAQGLAECVDSGMTKTVGVANYNGNDMIAMADALAEYDIPLATNQCEFSLLRRLPETSGLLEICRERGIHFQSYSSLAQSRLTGKWSAGNEPPKSYRFSSYPMDSLEPTIAVLREIAEKRGKPPAAVALNYNISKGILPVVGMRKPEQVQQNLEAFGWRLSVEEMQELDRVSLEGKATVLWQQG